MKIWEALPTKSEKQLLVHIFNNFKDVPLDDREMRLNGAAMEPLAVAHIILHVPW
jgi:hypothetical protein